MVEPELSVQSQPATNETDDHAARGDLILDDHFAPVPEWVLDSEISDCALRLYAVLLRFGQTSGARMPSRAALARRLHKGSTDTVDRAMRELVAIGAVAVERRRSMGVYLTNRYHLRTRSREAPADGRSDAAIDENPEPTGFDSVSADARASIHVRRDGLANAASSRESAPEVAADSRHNPEFLTQRKPSPPHLPVDHLHDLEEQRCAALAARLGLGEASGLHDLLAEVVRMRTKAGLPVVKWSTRSMLAALQLSVERGWPTDRSLPILKQLAVDANTRSPMRMAEAGPWWDLASAPPLRRTKQEESELEQLEAALAEREDRAWLQSRARAEIVTSGQTVDRLSVARRAFRLAEQTNQQKGHTQQHRAG